MSQGPSEHTSSERVLSAGPERDARSILQEILEQEGYHGISAEHGKMIKQIVSGPDPRPVRGQAVTELHEEAGNGAASRAPRASNHQFVDDRHDFRAMIKERNWVEPRRDILSEGDAPAELHVIVRGLAYRYKIMRDGSRRIINFLFPGDACDADLFCLPAMDHGVRTVVRTEVASFAREKLVELMQANPAVARIFWSSMAQDAAILRQWLVKMGHQQGHGRVAHLICELFLRYRMAGAASADSYVLQLTQDELADTLGMTPVHMNRVLQRLRKEGLIRLDGKRLTIVDHQGLEAAADFDTKYREALRRSPLGVQLGLCLAERTSAFD